MSGTIRSAEYREAIDELTKNQVIRGMADSLPAGVDCTTWEFGRLANAYAETQGVKGAFIGSVPEAIAKVYNERMKAGD